MPFDYILSVQSSWPPTGWPQPPFGPTAIDIMRSCPLRSCFDFSPGYERRMGVAARIGTAMHKTLQSLNEEPIQGIDLEIIAAEAGRRFNIELEMQKAQAVERHRETHLQWDPVRINRALEAVIAEAIRTHGSPSSQGGGSYSPNVTSNLPDSFTFHYEHFEAPIKLPECEIPVQSKDQLFRGRIDRAEKIQEGTRLVDYKSAYRDDLPEHYARQIQLYAYLWHETFGEWPVEGQVFYPLKGTFFQVPVEEDICRKVVAEAVALIQKLGAHKHPNKLAIPGNTCKVCDYRPWCQPFWAWQASEKILIKAKEKAAIGFEGQLENISLIEHYWKIIVNWRNEKIRIIVPQERFPHLVNAKLGQILRIIDAPVKGALSQPIVQVFNNTEIFLIL